MKANPKERRQETVKATITISVRGQEVVVELENDSLKTLLDDIKYTQEQLTPPQPPPPPTSKNVIVD
jgi:hypothetical protein